GGAQADAPGLAVAADGLDPADEGAAVADQVAVGDLLVLVRIDEQPGPRPAERRLEVALALGALFGAEAAVDQRAVEVGGGGDVERRLLAALDLEARHAGGAQRGDVVGQRQVLHGEGEATLRVAFGGGTVAQGVRGAGDLERVAAGVGALAAVARPP